MNSINLIGLLVLTYLVLFVEGLPGGVRDLIGVQIDLLPSIMVYAGMSSSVATVALLAFVGGIGFDGLSANPLGISILPLFAVGFFVQQQRELILSNQDYAQFVVGLAASALVPLFTLLSLFGIGEQPLIGWGSLLQWLLLALAGGLFTPFWFRLFGRLRKAFIYPTVAESSFNPDRQIDRGRA